MTTAGRCGVLVTHDAAPPPAVLMIVARENVALYSYLVDEFVRDRNLIEIVIDRRHHEAHHDSPTTTTERRQRDRRIRVVDDVLRTLGWALVRRDVTPQAGAVDQ
jgi:hypothetical protein